jgi:hypothetical protein
MDLKNQKQIKICKVCHIEKECPWRRRKCAECIYLSKKDYFKKYYQENGDAIRANANLAYVYQKGRQHDPPKEINTKKGRPRKYALIPLTV